MGSESIGWPAYPRLVLPIAAERGFSFADPYAIGLAFAGVAVFAAVGALSHQHERAFSASLIYLGLGIAAATMINLLGVRWIDPLAEATLIERLAEFALIVALFGTGLKLERALDRRTWKSVARLLGIVMPLTIAAVALFGNAVMELSLGAAIILGAALAPTDPVLAGDVGVGPPGDEDEHEPNFSLTSEAGLNDGLAFPFIFLGLLLAEDAGDAGAWVEWLLADVLYGVVAGVVAGGLLGLGFGLAVRRVWPVREGIGARRG
jgi:NhaP-type Na+/H+ or K+/H+ antiporter